MDYKINHPLFGNKTVAFNCEACGEELLCPLEDAGTQQPCPRCTTSFITPGQKELDEERQAEIKAKEAKEHAEIRAQQAKEHAEIEARQKAFRQQEEAHRHQHAAMAVELPPPELVWYGEMYCDSCGYRWDARRNTPPARCPSCSKRSAVPIKRPKRTGCAAVLLLTFMLLGSLAATAHHLWT